MKLVELIQQESEKYLYMLEVCIFMDPLKFVGFEELIIKYDECLNGCCTRICY